MTVTIEQIKQKQVELEAMIKAYEEQEEAEFPTRGSVYYYIDQEGYIEEDTFCNAEYDSDILSIGNCFRTKEEAKFALEQLKVIAELKRCGGVWKTKQGAEKEFVLLCNYDNVVVSFSFTEGCHPDIWFSTEAQAQKALETIGQERLLKYWFCVEVEE